MRKARHLAGRDGPILQCLPITTFYRYPVSSLSPETIFLKAVSTANRFLDQFHMSATAFTGPVC